MTNPTNLREALLLCDRTCEHLHHAKRHRHESGEPCPVEAIVETALLASVPEPEARQFYPHMCRDEHDEIGFRGDEELCPVCRTKNDAEALVWEFAAWAHHYDMETDIAPGAVGRFLAAWETKP
jgi:hypothetical protein